MSIVQDTTLVLKLDTTQKDLAPDIFRQRLLIEGYYKDTMTEERIRSLLLQIAATLNLRTYDDPVIFQPDSGMGKDKNAGFDAFVPLIDSGISGYFWTKAGFFSVLIYTCKGFDPEVAIDETRRFLRVDGEIVAHSF